jgi:hypothetical protein
MSPGVQKLAVVTVAIALGALAGYQWGRFATTKKERKAQEKLTGRLEETQRKLDASRQAVKNTALKLSQQRPFTKTLASYSEKDRAVIQENADAAVSGLPANASRFDRVAAVTSYVHQLLDMKPSEDGHAIDVIAKGGSNCGGFAVCAGELLAVLGVESDFVFLRGGTFGGHTMLQAFLDDGSGALVNPYFGVIYLNPKSGKPASATEVMNGDSVRPSHAIHKRAKDPSAINPYTRQEAAFSPDAPSSSTGYAFPDLFTKSDGLYEANSGVRDFIHIPLQPGRTLGSAAWKPTDEEPLPWSALQLWKQPSGQWLSWAFTLGQMPMGNEVAHDYSLSGLAPGNRYRLTLQVATAGNVPSSNLSGPVVTVHQVASGRQHARRFEERRYDSPESYAPQRMEIDFEATTPEMSFVAVASGYFMFNCITLEAR